MMEMKEKMVTELNEFIKGINKEKYAVVYTPTNTDADGEPLEKVSYISILEKASKKVVSIQLATHFRFEGFVFCMECEPSRTTGSGAELFKTFDLTDKELEFAFTCQSYGKEPKFVTALKIVENETGSAREKDILKNMVGIVLENQKDWSKDKPTLVWNATASAFLENGDGFQFVTNPWNKHQLGEITQ